MSPENYAIMLNNSKCCVGNSSSFIRECSFLGIPSVIIGDRQKDREHGRNVIFCGYDQTEIENKIRTQLEKKSFKKQTLFGDGNAGTNIAKEISRYLNNIN